MRIEVSWVDEVHEGLSDLERSLGQDPRFDDVPIARGRPVVPRHTLGAAEVLELVATNVGLGIVANALYGYLRQRVRAGLPESNAKLRLTRIDLPDGVRQVDIEYSGPVANVEQIVRDALGDDWPRR
ncbi:hypothetical protein [Micromonospora sp. WMMC250]|uniref:hypothetical protein n=1 Tax=Micromonospora sp. WMMC250 TaxID=3014781 RepID=UPI0022B73267|nr:hypothetical protein [Micromonospora sp. WMMC250]MCZ7374677.1 hypothetical protein [Micromonospora sp. WMMC250]